MKIIRETSFRGKRKLYLASLNPDLDKEILLPTVPNNFLTKGKFEEWQIKRICLYENIDDALSSFLGQELKDSLVYIYEPVGVRPESLIKPSITSVPYIMQLPELWYCTSLRVKLAHVIQVSKKKSTLTYHYGPRQTKAFLYRWDWKEKLNKYGKSLVEKHFSHNKANKKLKGQYEELLGIRTSIEKGKSSTSYSDNKRLGRFANNAIQAEDILENKQKLKETNPEKFNQLRKELATKLKPATDNKAQKIKRNKIIGIALGSTALLGCGGYLAYKHHKNKKEDKNENN